MLGHGGKRSGAGRKPKAYWDKVKSLECKNSAGDVVESSIKSIIPKQPPSLEKMVASVLNGTSDDKSIDVKRLAHKVAYVEQEVEFIKKIILAEIEAARK